MRQTAISILIMLFPVFADATTKVDIVFDTITESPAKDVLIKYQHNKTLNIKEGFYTLSYKNKVLIKGEFSLNQRDGLWQFFGMNDTLQLKGNYRADKKDGMWKSFYHDGKLSCQEYYLNGSKEDLCIGYFPDGMASFIKSYKNNRVDSVEMYFYEDGKVWFTKNYKDGKLNGLTKKFYENGNIAEFEMLKDGKRDGDYRQYYDNGILWEYTIYKNGGIWNIINCNSPENKPGKCIPVKDGIKDGTGVARLFDIKGRLRSEEKYEKGLKDGYAKYYKDGLMTSEGNYRDDKKEGLWKYYNETEKLYAELHYLKDKPEGKAVYYYNNGQKSLEGTLKNGERDGIWVSYSEDGILKWEFTYVNEKLEGKTKKYDLGKIVSKGVYKDNTRVGLWTFYNDGVAYSKIDFGNLPNSTNTENRPMIHPVESEQVYSFAERMPQFPGGQRNLEEFLKKNTIYPEYLKDKNIEGTIIVSFTVSSTGEITDAKILKGIHIELDKEAIKIILSMPRWDFGMISGQPVAVQYKLPIKYGEETD